ncbi:MAG: PaaI family thioesterase [Proteobacteria bacterium]|nr:PaaI family thioesterase [Pseudomonadota bacterium]
MTTDINRLVPVINLPYHQFLGVQNLRGEAGRGFLSITVNQNNANPLGALHGGVIYSLCDVCAYAALLSIMEDENEAVTHDIHVSVLRSARLGQKIDFEAEVVKKGRTLCFIDAAARVEGNVIAAARVTKSIVKRVL